jgi:3-hydroxyisobutyrate dehydrogenase
MKIGFIGLGNVGAPLAANLLRAGHALTVNDLERGAARDLLAAGAAWADSPRALATDAQAVITSLPSPAAVRTVLEGKDGVLAGLGVGSAWIEMSTNDAEEIKRLAARAAAQGIATLEAPITGGCHRAKSGEITILVGGEEAVYESHLPLFQAMGSTVLHVGTLGQASVLKVITNMLAKRGGVDLATTFEGIKASSGNSFVHETESQVILNGSYNIGFTMDLASKDLGLAHQLGRDLGVPLELAGLVEQIFHRARLQYGDRAWSSQVVKLLEDALGTELRAAGFPAVLEDQPTES